MHTLAINLAHVGAWTSLCEFNGLQMIKCLKNLKNLFYATAIYNGGGGHIASPLSLRPYIHTYVRTSRVISFEYISVLDSYFIHRYIIIKYRLSSITDKIYRLLSELWPLISVRKMVSGRYLLNT